MPRKLTRQQIALLTRIQVRIENGVNVAQSCLGRALETDDEVLAADERVCAWRQRPEILREAKKGLM